MKTATGLAGPVRIKIEGHVDSGALATIASMSIEQVRTRLSEVCVLQARLDAEKIALNARMVSLMDDPETPAYVVPERELMAHGGLTSREARDVVARGVVSEVAPTMIDALVDGSTTAAHLDALGRGLRIAGDRRDEFLTHIADLVDAATSMSISEFGHLVKETAKSVVIDDGLSTLQRQQRETMTTHRVEGWVTCRARRLLADLQPAARPSARIESSTRRAADVVARRQAAPDGVKFSEGVGRRLFESNVAPSPPTRVKWALIPGGRGGETRTGQRATPFEHLGDATTRWVCRTVSGADLPVEAVRRLACEADIIPVVLDGRSVPIDVGRAKRLATAHQRRALEAVHTTCAVPECDVRFDRCHIHHIDYWEHGGTTDLVNMVPLCNKHHHAVHEGKRDIHSLIGGTTP